MEDTVEKHGLGKFVKFSHKIVEADWLEDEGKWKLIIMRGDDPTNTITDYADFFIHGGGVLKSVISHSSLHSILTVSSPSLAIGSGQPYPA